MDQEIIAKAKEAKSAEELLAMAKENGMELTEEEAEEYYDRLHASGELADDELDSVAGGSSWCTNTKCPRCDSKNYHETDEIYYQRQQGTNVALHYLQCDDCGKKF